MQIYEVDNGIRELFSTSSNYFEPLLYTYQFRADILADKSKVTEVLCCINRQAAKRIGLRELASTWKSLAKIADEIKLHKEASDILKHQITQQSPVASPLPKAKP